MRRFSRIRCRHSIRHLLVSLGLFSFALNCFFFTVFWRLGRDPGMNHPSGVVVSKSSASDYPNTSTFKTFLRTLASDGDSARGGKSSVAAIERWTQAVSSFLSSTGEVGWGKRTGGIILAGAAQQMCGVEFAGNTIRMNQQFPKMKFKAPLEMLAGGGGPCKKLLERAATSGWHQGQIFFYRLEVDRPGHYAVRLTVILNHEDEKRGDGVVLALEDLLEIRVQCVVSKARYVVEPVKAGENGETMAVLEVHTVALGGEILLELEGTYTCVGLSLVETFFHDDLEALGDDADGHHLIAVPVPHLGKPKNAARLVPLHEAWTAAGSVCAQKFTAEANLQRELQQKSSSSEAAAGQRYFNEWAKRERLEQSAGRYCRPRQAPRPGERGWTWAGKSTRLEREAAELAARAAESRKAQEAAATAYRNTVQAAIDAGAAPGAAALLAAEAVDKAILNSNGKALSEEARRAAEERVVKAAQYMAIGSINGNVKTDAAGTHHAPAIELADSEESEVIFDKGRRRRRLNDDPADEIVIATRIDSSRRTAGGGARTTAGAGAAGADVKRSNNEQTEKPAMGTWASLPGNEPIPPPMCPPRLLDLIEEALHDAAATPVPGPDWDQARSAVSDGAAAAAERARSRSQGAAGRSYPAAGWGFAALPKWLGYPRGRDEELEREILAKRALGSGFEAVAAFRAHDVVWPNRESNSADSGNRWGLLGLGAKAGVAGFSFPLQLTGFTWDGVTVVMKETVPGCARIAQPIRPRYPEASKLLHLGSSWGSELWTVSEEKEEPEPPAEEVGKEEDGGGGGGGGIKRALQEVDGASEDAAAATAEKRACLAVEAMVVPSAETVVDLIVPVSAGLVPRLLTLMPQMERLAKGSGCTPLPPDHLQAPKCLDSEYYAPAFWPDQLSRRGPLGGAIPPYSGNWLQGLRSSRNATVETAKTAQSLRGQAAAGGGNFRVIVATDDPSVEELLKQYDVDTVHVPTKAPFSKARAIQDASAVIPDENILFVHDADLFPPCSLPDALRQTVVKGVQAVNLLLPYENQAAEGKCLYPISTFGPIAMYKSDFSAVGGMEDTNNGRWGFEDTSFLHKVMLGQPQLGVLRVHLPGLVHKWHEITPWKCLVWVWGGPASGVRGPDCDKEQLEDPPDSPANILGA